MDAEEAAVRAFIAPNRLDRWLMGLANPKRRQKLAERLHAGFELIDKYMQPAPSDSVEDLVAEIGRRGGSTRCHVIGGRLDGHEHDLREALQVAVDEYGGVLIVCVPGSLAVFLREAPSEFLILSR